MATIRMADGSRMPVHVVVGPAAAVWTNVKQPTRRRRSKVGTIYRLRLPALSKR